MRYWPLPSVTTALAPSISAGLDASTVTPGSTPPEVSLTTPVIDAWAYAAAGTTASHVSTTAASRRDGLRFTLTSCSRFVLETKTRRRGQSTVVLEGFRWQAELLRHVLILLPVISRLHQLEWLRVVLWIIHRDCRLEVVLINSPPALLEFRGIRMRKAGLFEPASRV